MSLTREKIMDLGETLIRTRGYNGFSYNDISSELGIKNAAVHYYFPSKESLGTAIVRTNLQRFEEMVENIQSREFNELQQLDAFLKIYIRSNREKKLCIVGAMSPDINTLNESTASELKKLVEYISAWLTELLAKGREKGIFAFVGEPREKALTIFSSLVSGLQLSRVVENFDFKSLYRFIQEDLKA